MLTLLLILLTGYLCRFTWQGNTRKSNWLNDTSHVQVEVAAYELRWGKQQTDTMHHVRNADKHHRLLPLWQTLNRLALVRMVMPPASTMLVVLQMCKPPP